MNSFEKLHLQFSANLTAPYYHLVSDELPNHIKYLYKFRTINQFINDLDFYLKNYNIVDLHQVIDYVKVGKPLPINPLFLSFDDGFREVYDIIVPILYSKGVPATFFVTKQFIDNKELFYRNKASLLLSHIDENPLLLKEISNFLEGLSIPTSNVSSHILSIDYNSRAILDNIAAHIELDFQCYLNTQSPYLTSSQIKVIIEKGFTIGSHSVDHPKYNLLSLSEQVEQTRLGMEYVQHQFNLTYKAFAFPFNDNRISTRFYKTMKNENIIDISFGSSGIVGDVAMNNLQRCSFDNMQQTASEIMCQYYVEKQNRLLIGKDLIKRPFC